MNKWIWFLVVTIFDILSIAHSSCDDLCGLDKIVVDNDNIEEKVTIKFRNGQGNIINCFDTSKVTDMSYLFDVGYYDLLANFNEDISCWDTSGVTSMKSMFYEGNRGISSFNGDISSWDTSSVIDMSSMFDGASKFNSDISDWDTSSVIDMSDMFHRASLFSRRLCDWNVNQVTSNSFMFTGGRCTKKSCLDCIDTSTPTSNPTSIPLAVAPSIPSSVAPSISLSIPPTPEPPKPFTAKSKRMCNYNVVIDFFKEEVGCDVECNKVESCVAYQVMPGVGCTLFSGTNTFKSGDKFSDFDCREKQSKKENRICDPRGMISLSKGSKLSKCKKACKKNKKCKYHMLVKNENCLLFDKIGKATKSKKKLMKKFTCHTSS